MRHSANGSRRPAGPVATVTAIPVLTSAGTAIPVRIAAPAVTMTAPRTVGQVMTAAPAAAAMAAPAASTLTVTT